MLRDTHPMRRLGVTSWLLLAVLSLLWSGLGHALHHQHLEHCPGDHGPCAASDHHKPRDQPAPSQPDDHDDCATCHLMASVKASTLDFDVSQAPSLADAHAAPVMLLSVTTLDRLGVPSGRAPPQLHL